MLQVIRTERYASWARSLRDDRAAAKIAIRVDRLAHGNAGDVKPVGGGVSEMRIDYGPGYRVYFARRGNTLILLLCGGTKKSQTADVEDAKRLLADWKTDDQDRSI
ncbi:type II toxin-antitoxin system RelE/ParE family toxin [Tardiphaga alba]|uniref:Type II toxin-antitoxin system RelE/ParE family toxin n=1 Tax=Tardiphaga alba TaxID=340268 RepID=A0ABX8ABH0_9BRAD|nr:type II toxin-antitoxin system RelE/ParE family toxin [Tardiphaga alba]QUS40641.1 type II toxin-antitoxin system RelE/ParE family toxin [Tardiphaga alba]